MNYRSDNEMGTLQPKDPILSIDPDIYIPLNRAGTAIDAARYR